MLTINIPLTNDVARQSCLDYDDMQKYLQGVNGYAWHITECVVYDEPKELSELTRLQKTRFGYRPVEIAKPPQSWYYVE